MPAKNLILLTHKFPVKNGEPWLAAETTHIFGQWNSVSIFCEANTDKENSAECAQIKLLPNSFIYKRQWGTFIHKHFIAALGQECTELLRKGRFMATIANSVSLLLRMYALAKWFTKQYIKQEEKYLIYSYWGDEYATMACLLKTMNRNITIVCRVHGIDVYEERTRLQHIQFRKFQLKHLSKMFSVSGAGADYIKARYPTYAAKVTTSYLGTLNASGVINPLPNAQRLEMISCAMVRNVKRLELIIETLKHIKTPARWILAGNGPDFEKLKAVCAQLPPNITVELPGYLTDGEIENLYKTRPFHFYISVSAYEGLPVAMMESISYGVPILSTRVGGCPEIVNKTTGTLIPEDFKPEELAKTLENLYLNYNYSTPYRQQIQQAWNVKFNAANNYKNFYKMLEEISR